MWSTSLQGYILASFFYGYVATQVSFIQIQLSFSLLFHIKLKCLSFSQIPFGILAKRYGALNFLGYGMLINSVFAFFVPVAARQGGWLWLCIVRLIQGLGEGPIVNYGDALVLIIH